MYKTVFGVKMRRIKSKIAYLILISLFLSGLYITYNTELSFDECYYWVFSKYPSFGYFDHPPMVAWSISIGTFLFGHSEFAVRLMSSIYLLGTLLILAKLVGRKLTDLNFVLLFVSMPLIVTSGMVALPDTPLMFFSTLFFLCTRIYLQTDNIRNACVLGLVIAAMFYSKYHGLLIVLFTVLAHLPFLKRKSFYLIVIIVIVLFLPHMYWQYQHDFISFKFHLFGRVEKHFDYKNILNYLGGQFVLMGFLLSPLFAYITFKNKFSNAFERIMFFNSFGILIFLFFMSFRNQIEANWTISCSVALVILVNGHIDNHNKLFKIFAFSNLALLLLIRIVLIYPEAFVSKGTENRLNEIYGWKMRVQKIINYCGPNKIVGDNYQISARMAFHLNRPEIASLHYGSRESHYSILKLQGRIHEDEKICYLTSKNILDARKVESGYKDPVYVINNITLKKLKDIYGAIDEKIIGN